MSEHVKYIIFSDLLIYNTNLQCLLALDLIRFCIKLVGQYCDQHVKIIFFFFSSVCIECVSGY